MKIKLLAASALAAAAVAVLGASLPSQAFTLAAAPEEALPMRWVVGHLARKSSADLVEMVYRDNAFQATVRYGDGRIGRLEIDAETGRIRPAPSPDLLRNSFDGVAVSDLPVNGRKAHEVIAALMADGGYRDVRGLRREAGAWRVVMVDRGGAQVDLLVDPQIGRIL